jgi:His/Glu/Gln/Arg/opine family amino acid ABC transporter permease subunit
MAYSFSFEVVWRNWPYLVSGVGITLFVTVVSLVAGTLIGLVIGVMRLSKNRVLSSIGRGYVGLLRNTPVLVQLIWVYYCVPILTGLEMDSTTSCIVALSLHGGAYVGEIIRGGIQGVDRGQVEAARTVGLSHFQTLRKVVLPQALRRMIPPLVNEAVTLLKYSSLVSVLGVADLTYNAQVLATTTFRPIEIFTFVALEYLVLCIALSYAAALVERRLAAAE